MQHCNHAPGRWPPRLPEVSLMRYVAPGLVLLFLFAPSTAFSNAALVGSWQYKDARMDIVTEFLTDGSFRQVTVGPQGRQAFSGRYKLSGQSLYLQADGGQPAVQAACRFADPDTAVVAYASGETLTWKRVSVQKPSPAPPKPSEPPSAAVVTPPAGGASTKTIKTLMVQRTWEPREQAFTFLLPQGWTLEGGVFNVNPLQMNGPGNTTTPKCDLAVKAEARGTVMLRWAPSWNYADLSLSPIKSSRTAGAPMPKYATSSGCSSPGRRSTPTPSTARPSATLPITGTAG